MKAILPRLMTVSLCLLAVALVPATAPAAATSPMGGEPVDLGRLASLVGEWQATSPEGGPVRATYELVGDGSALVERLSMGPGGTMVTVFHRDGDKLALTHYCSMHNQPRMETSQPADAKDLQFAFVGATNLPSADAPHMHTLKIAFLDADHFDATWTMSQGGQSKPNTFHFQRVK